jgi:hypothetical protein
MNSKKWGKFDLSRATLGGYEQHWKRTRTKKKTIGNTKEKGGNLIHSELHQGKEY